MLFPKTCPAQMRTTPRVFVKRCQPSANPHDHGDMTKTSSGWAGGTSGRFYGRGRARFGPKGLFHPVSSSSSPIFFSRCAIDRIVAATQSSSSEAPDKNIGATTTHFHTTTPLNIMSLKRRCQRLSICSRWKQSPATNRSVAGLGSSRRCTMRVGLGLLAHQGYGRWSPGSHDNKSCSTSVAPTLEPAPPSDPRVPSDTRSGCKAGPFSCKQRANFGISKRLCAPSGLVTALQHYDAHERGPIFDKKPTTAPCIG